jgi:hypothetical protein
MKRTGVARAPLRRGEKLRDKVAAQLPAIKRTPQLVRSFFQAPTVAYIIDLRVTPRCAAGHPGSPDPRQARRRWHCDRNRERSRSRLTHTHTHTHTHTAAPRIRAPARTPPAATDQIPVFERVFPGFARVRVPKCIHPVQFHWALLVEATCELWPRWRKGSMNAAWPAELPNGNRQKIPRRIQAISVARVR